MEVAALNQGASPLSGGVQGANQITSDFDTFLRLLTTQIQNQDPLNPSDSTEFVAQLATFSSVEQQVLTNDLLSEMSQASAFEELGTWASWLGKEVVVSGPIQFDDDAVSLTWDMPALQTYNEYKLVVQNMSGETVGVLSLSPGQEAMNWSGQTDGGILAGGLYKLSLAEVTPTGDNIVSDVHQVGLFQEAKLEGGAVKAVLATGQAVESNRLLSVRAP